MSVDRVPRGWWVWVLCLILGGPRLFAQEPAAVPSSDADAATETAESPEPEVVEHPFTWDWDPVRFTALGELRVRVESFDDYDFDDRLEDADTVVNERVRVGFEADAWERVLIHLEAQDAEQQGTRQPPDPNEDGPDLRRAYLSVHDLGPMSATVGRQDLSLGAERILGTYEFRSLDRHFDAARVQAALGPVDLGVFYARPVVQLDGSFNHANQEVDLFGGHAGWQVTPNICAEVLYVHYADDRKTFAELIEEAEDPDTGETVEVVTREGDALELDLLDLRVYATFFEELVLDCEVAGQRGDFGKTSLRSFAFWSSAAYTFRSWFGAPLVGVAYNHSSGDSDPTDDHTNTWVSLFPTIPNYGGYCNANLRETVFTLGLEPIPNLKFQADYRLLDLDRPRDAFYGEDFGVYLNDATGEQGREVGRELDLWASYSFNDRVSVEAAYATFHSGDFARGASGDDAGPWYSYFQVKVGF